MYHRCSSKTISFNHIYRFEIDSEYDVKYLPIEEFKKLHLRNTGKLDLRKAVEKLSTRSIALSSRAIFVNCNDQCVVMVEDKRNDLFLFANIENSDKCTLLYL